MRYNLVTMKSNKPCVMSCLHPFGRVLVTGLRRWLIPVDDGALGLLRRRYDEKRSHRKLGGFGRCSTKYRYRA